MIRDVAIVCAALAYGAYDLAVTPPLDATTVTLVLGLLGLPAFLRSDKKTNGSS
jgi:hypothetical protein